MKTYKQYNDSIHHFFTYFKKYVDLTILSNDIQTLNENQSDYDIYYNETRKEFNIFIFCYNSDVFTPNHLRFLLALTSNTIQEINEYRQYLISFKLSEQFNIISRNDVDLMIATNKFNL